MFQPWQGVFVYPLDYKKEIDFVSDFSALLMTCFIKRLTFMNLSKN